VRHLDYQWQISTPILSQHKLEVIPNHLELTRGMHTIVGFQVSLSLVAESIRMALKDARINPTPKGYAPPVSQGSRVTPEKQPPPPWTVPNQWPEGTGSQAVADALVSFEVTADNKVEEGEVIYVEWSDNGVVHGEPLIESED